MGPTTSARTNRATSISAVKANKAMIHGDDVAACQKAPGSVWANTPAGVLGGLGDVGTVAVLCLLSVKPR